MKDIRTYLIIGLFVWIALLLTCNDKEIEYKTNTVTRVEWETYHDTIIKTVEIPRTKLIFVDSSNRLDLSDTNVFYTDYHYNHSDSLLDASIFVQSDIRPANVELTYKMKQFTLKDSVYVRDSVYTKENKSFMSVGATMIGSQNSFGFAPQLQYNHKKGNTYSLGYDVLNGNLTVGFTKKLSFKK